MQAYIKDNKYARLRTTGGSGYRKMREVTLTRSDDHYGQFL